MKSFMRALLQELSEIHRLNPMSSENMAIALFHNQMQFLWTYFPFQKTRLVSSIHAKKSISILSLSIRNNSETIDCPIWKQQEAFNKYLNESRRIKNIDFTIMGRVVSRIVSWKVKMSLGNYGKSRQWIPENNDCLLS